MGFVKKALNFIVSSTHSRTMGILIFFILVVVVSLTVIVSQQQQQLRQRASENPACEIINSISDCTFSANSSNVSCEKPTDKCKIGNKIYECVIVETNNNNGFN